jgi:hypothetical protein
MDMAISVMSDQMAEAGSAVPLSKEFQDRFVRDMQTSMFRLMDGRCENLNVFIKSHRDKCAALFKADGEQIKRNFDSMKRR